METATAEAPIKEAPATTDITPAVVEPGMSLADRIFKAAGLEPDTPELVQKAEKKAPAPAADVDDQGDEQEEGDEEEVATVAAPTLTKDEEIAKAIRADFGLEDESPSAEVKVTKPVTDWFAKNKIDPKKALEIPQMETRISTLETENKKLAAQVDQWKTLPLEIRNATIKALRGEPYRDEFNAPDLDFEKPYDQHDPQVVVPLLSGAKFTKAELKTIADGDAEDDLAERWSLAERLAKNSYESTANGKKSYLRDLSQKQKDYTEGFSNSAKATMENMVKNRKSLAAFAPTIEEGLTPQGIQSDFMDEKGFLKADAAENRAWSKPEIRNVILNAFLNKQAKVAKEEAELSTLARADERPRAGSGNKKQVKEAAPKTNAASFIESMVPGFKATV